MVQEQNSKEQHEDTSAVAGSRSGHAADDAASDDEQPVGLNAERAAAEAQEFKDKYMRSVAEMENMRRRMERERTDLVKFAAEKAFKDFLPVLDTFQKALPDADAVATKDATGVDRGFVDGMVMVKRQLLEVFKKHGLEIVHARGEVFDPNLHQAIQRVESPDVTVETVGDEFAQGYMLNGRLLRPAMVSVLIPVGSD